MEKLWRWLPAVAGAAIMALGLWALLAPQQAVQLLPVLLGVAALCLGAGHVGECVRAGRFSAEGPLGIPHLAQGIVNIAVGIVLLVKRAVSVAFLGAALGLWSVVSGGLSLRAAWELRNDPLMRGSVLDGIIKIGVGVLMLLRPFGTMTLWTQLMSVFLLFAGASAIASTLWWNSTYGKY